ncbi:hypothetical protein C8Q76DRAFT_804516 [Earliella scabrosa]|nr:hypothetical protein C8Q76DRAFT_804516 [Earliella scabrosa]
MLSAFDELVKQIEALDEQLRLAILNHTFLRWRSASSLKRPDDLPAFKLAFFKRLATHLMTAVKGLHASVVLGDGVKRREIENEAALNIVTPEGLTFRARIWHAREATLA